MDKTLQYICAVLGGVMGFCFGELDGLFYALLAFVVMDYITGLIVAWRRKELSSAIGFNGLAKKVLIFCLVALGHIIDAYVLKTGAVLQSAITLFYIANEGISVTENAANMGVPIPKKLIDVLQQIKKDEEGE